MKSYTNYIKESKDEDIKNQFIELCHINELEIRFNFMETKSKAWLKSIVYFYNDDIIFYYSQNETPNKILLNSSIYSKLFVIHKSVVLNEIFGSFFKNIKILGTLGTSWIKDHKNNWL